MPWLADTDVGAAHGFARGLLGVRTVAELRRRALGVLVDERLLAGREASARTGR